MKVLDFSTFKDFPLRERTRLQFRAEIFNILNHPNFGYAGQFLGRVQLRRDLEHRQLSAAEHPARAEIGVLNGDIMAARTSFAVVICCAAALVAQKPAPRHRLGRLE